jgi:hypothetical protein
MMPQNHPIPTRVKTYPQTHLSEDVVSTLVARLRAQVEYYFSFQNLIRDTFLQSLLTSTDRIGSVPTEIIATFPKVRELYATSIGSYGILPPADQRFIARALRESDVVSISEDGEWISPRDMPDFQSISMWNVVQGGISPQFSDADSQNTSVSSFGAPTHPHLQPIPGKEPTTAIVQGLPPDCTEQEIVDVFTTGSVEPKNVRQDAGNTWYINFSTGADAVSAVAASWGKKVRGSPIQARMKTEAPVQMQSSNYPPTHNAMSPACTHASPYSYLTTQSPVYASYDLPYLSIQQHSNIPAHQVELQQCSIVPASHVEVQQHTTIADGSSSMVLGIPEEIPVHMRYPERSPRQRYKPRKRSRKRPATRNKTEREELDGNGHSSASKSAGDEKIGSSKTAGGSASKKSWTPRNENRRGAPSWTSPGGDPQILSEDNFPILGSLSKDVSNTADSQTTHKFAGYAHALLKSPGKAKDDEVGNEITPEEVTERMQQTSISTERTVADT